MIRELSKQCLWRKTLTAVNRQLEDCADLERQRRSFKKEINRPLGRKTNKPDGR